MPREGTKTKIPVCFAVEPLKIEIRYAPGGDENIGDDYNMVGGSLLRLDMPREGTKTNRNSYLKQ